MCLEANNLREVFLLGNFLYIEPLCEPRSIVNPTLHPSQLKLANLFSMAAFARIVTSFPSPNNTQRRIGTANICKPRLALAWVALASSFPKKGHWIESHQQHSAVDTIDFCFSRLQCRCSITMQQSKSPNSTTQRKDAADISSISSSYNGRTAQSYNLVSKSSRNYMDGLHIKNMEKCEEARALLHKVEGHLECWMMIDAMQRLGIDYHFEEEIKAIFKREFEILTSSGGSAANGSLHDAALRFRLLRQAGYCVPSDMFGNFMDNEGFFKPELSEDIVGMMSLYEASHLRIEGEYILDEANDFARKHLNSSMMILEPDLAREVRNTLEQPCHKSLARFKAKHCLKNFNGTYGWISLLQELAKMDFNIVQSLHQRELHQISKWWRELGLAQELKFVRDQPLKWYMWPMMMVTDPKFSEHRIELTKPISLIYVIDDIFDVLGTLDELVLFTEAINKWEVNDTEQLPDYMKICFNALDRITNEIGEKVLREHGWNPVDSLRKSWASLCNAFLVEAKWFASGQVPKAEEYLKNGVVSSGVHVVLVHLFFLLGQGITKDSINCVERIPGFVSCPATILRLWDDLGSAKDENQEGHDGSYLECYKKEQGSCSNENAQEHVFHMISDSWKRLNRECLSPNPFSPSFKRASLNLARMVPVMYSYDNNQRLPTLEEYIESLLYESIPL